MTLCTLTLVPWAAPRVRRRAAQAGAPAPQPSAKPPATRGRRASSPAARLAFTGHGYGTLTAGRHGGP